MSEPTLFDIEIDTPFKKPITMSTPTAVVTLPTTPKLSPAAQILEESPPNWDVTPSPPGSSSSAVPVGPAPTTQPGGGAYNQVKLRYLERLNFDRSSIEQHAQIVQTSNRSTKLRTQSYPVPIPSPKINKTKTPKERAEKRAKKSRKEGSTSLQITKASPGPEEKESASFIPPHLLGNETTFSVQHYQDRKRMARALAF